MNIRGQTVLNTVRFVKARYGEAAHERVLAALPPDVAGMFLAPVRDASWKSLSHTLAYMRAARGLLAPGDDAFNVELGRFSGRAHASGGFRFLIGSDPLTAVGRAAFMWRFLYDTGRVEVIDRAPRQITIRIVDFDPGDRAWCERITGFLEAVAHVAGGRDGRVIEEQCRCLGAQACVMRGTWS